MSKIFFAIVEGRPAFFEDAVHGDNIPADAVQVTPAKRDQLLQGEAGGKIITADPAGKPSLLDRVIGAADRRAQLVAAVKREAARRIDAVSPIWRQLNDARAGGSDAEARFAQIDAIRAASQQIEADIAAAKSADVVDFAITENTNWPEPA